MVKLVIMASNGLKYFTDATDTVESNRFVLLLFLPAKGILNFNEGLLLIFCKI